MIDNEHNHSNRQHWKGPGKPGHCQRDARRDVSVADNKKLPGTSGKSKEDWTSQWWYCTAFKELAEAIVQDVKRGDRVEVTGKIDMHEYTAKDGTQKVAYNLLVNRIAKVVRPMRANNGGFNNMGSEAADEEIPF